MSTQSGKFQTITLVCTRHDAKGACNLEELYRIVECINPDVIFEELPPSAFDDYYVSKTEFNLESRTINAYLKEHQIRHIPVDLEFDPATLIKKNGIVHRRVEANSRDYCRLMDWNFEYAFQYGFKYLNSEYCSTNQADLSDVIEKTLEKLNDEELFQIHKEWNDLIEKREIEMIDNIYQYCREHDFERGLFFIGAAHRKSIIEKIKARSADITVAWNHDNYL